MLLGPGRLPGREAVALEGGLFITIDFVRTIMGKKAIVALAAVFLAAAPAMAGKSSVELGKKLFNDPTLGGSTNSTSCNTCHPGGKKLARAGKRKDLTAMINRCIVGPLKGERIDGRTVAMRSLKLYIKSLAE